LTKFFSLAQCGTCNKAIITQIALHLNRSFILLHALWNKPVSVRKLSPVHSTDGLADRRTTCDRKTALCTI